MIYCGKGPSGSGPRSTRRRYGCWCFEANACQALGPIHPTDPVQIEWGFARTGLSIHLWQKGPEGPIWPIGFYSRSFKDAGKRYTTWEKGLFVDSLALREAERTIRLQPIILWDPFKVTKAVLTGTPPPDGVAQRASVWKCYDLFREMQAQWWPVTREECKTCMSSREQCHVHLGIHPLENNPLHVREGKGLWEAWQVDYYSFLLTREASSFLFLFSRKEQPTRIRSPRGSKMDTDCDLIGIRMLFLIILVRGCTYESNRRSIPSPPTDPYDPCKDNEFVLLAKAVSRTFNLSHCWVCGGPLELSSWPWTSTPLTPAQIVNNYSETTNDTWGDSGTWPIQFPAVRQYCLKRVEEGGIHVGESKCKWTLTCKLADKDRGVHIWMWLDEVGRNQGFKGYWSSKNETFFLQRSNYYPYSQVCEWKYNSGTWYCTGHINDSPNEFFSPFGDKDTTRFQSPRETAGTFAYGKKGSLLDLRTHCLQTFTGRMVRDL